ncbi:MAG: electron transport complex subunit E [Firmicutes bacterium]|nr:electron transport complex subunit E [Bacillota bacterium]
MNKYTERLYNGLIKENPTLVLMLGMCPTLAVSTQAMNGIGMGLSTTAVLILSNVVISALRKVIPDEVRLPSYIVIVASLVTVTELLIEAYLPSLYKALGIYIPLIVVNCIILGRAEAYANKNTIGLSAMDGLGMGLGFTIALTLAGLVREVLGSGTAFGLQVLPESVEPIGIFVQPPGAFLVIALFIIIMNAIGIKTRQRQLVESNGCEGGCAGCMAAATCPSKGKNAEKGAAK